jgi:integrase
VSVRKRTWKSPNGEMREAWVVDYVDQSGDRHIKTFAKKRDADAHHAIVGTAVRAGTHTADSKSVTVAKAAELWLGSCDGLERATLAAYRQHVALRIVPVLGALRLSQLTVPLVRGFEDRLAADGHSPVMVRKARRLLGALIADAQERGLVGQNVVRSLRTSRRRKGARVERVGRKLKVGVDIPSPDEIRAIIAKLATIGEADRFRPLLLTAIFTGLRASELRGLRWEDVDLKRGELHVRQRADRYGKIGPTKSAAGERTVPLPPMVVSVLREHRLACPHSGLAFPNSRGNIDRRSSIVERGLHPAQVAAGVVDEHGAAKYKGLHSLRHFYASWCINRRVDGGLELPLKVVQARLGHASVQVTADVYGHLFPRGDDGAELAAAERAFLS